jgi:transmembrane sensor
MAAKKGTRADRRRREEAVDWFLRNQEPGDTTARSEAFEQWLSAHPDNRAAYDKVGRLMGEARSAMLGDSSLSSYRPKPRNTGRRVASVAAVAGLAATLFWLADGPMRLQADAMSGTGERPVIALADGSQMQLNAYSAVAYAFEGERRVVRLLRGEAFFQVAKDVGRPFIVEAMGGQVRALGTAFNVRLGQNQTEVTVTEHAVAVSSSDLRERAVRVDANQEIAYASGGKLGAVAAADPDAALAWRRGQLVVDNATLQRVIDEIGRHYSGRIVIATTALAQRRVSGTFVVSDPAAALTVLQQTLGISVTQFGPLLVLRG